MVENSDLPSDLPFNWMECLKDEWLERLRRELNPAQYQFATSTEPVILGLAGPGSGKSRALVFRTAHLI